MVLLLLVVGAVFVLLTVRPHPPSDPIVIYVDRAPEHAASLGCAPIALAVLLVLALLSLLPA